MARDIDYAAAAVRSAIMEKFGQDNDLDDLHVRANASTISLSRHGQEVEGTRGPLLATIRRATTYEDWWNTVAGVGKVTGGSVRK
jgi:hypothetical protein